MTDTEFSNLKEKIIDVTDKADNASKEIKSEKRAFGQNVPRRKKFPKRPEVVQNVPKEPISSERKQELEDKNNIAQLETSIKNLVRDKEIEQLNAICKNLPTSILMSEIANRMKFMEDNLATLEKFMGDFQSMRHGRID